MELKVITTQDLEWARKLRNKNRKHFVQKHIITEEGQKEWYKNLQKEKDISFYIIWVDCIKVGTISTKHCFGYNEGFIEIHNVLIDEKYRGQGLTKQAIGILREFNEGELFRIEALVTNEPALRVYINAGFESHAIVLYG